MAKKHLKIAPNGIETKYVISKETLADLLKEFEAYMAEDECFVQRLATLLWHADSSMIRVFGEASPLAKNLRVRTYYLVPRWRFENQESA